MNAEQKAALTGNIVSRIQNFSKTQVHLAGLEPTNSENVFAKQIVDSIRRVQYVETVARLSAQQTTSYPSSNYFNPIKASVYHKNMGNYEEACWLVFLTTHCGKHMKFGWQLARELYGLVDPENQRTWQYISHSPSAFSDWLAAFQGQFKGRFGNHRKYESLDIKKRLNTGEIVDSYSAWVRESGGHEKLFNTALADNGGSATETFAYLYKTMSRVHRFGRTAKFDYLTMLAKLGLLNIEPDKAYLSEATGPKKGIRLLVKNDPTYPLANQKAENIIASLGEALLIPSMLMQVMEDAICNWCHYQVNTPHFCQSKNPQSVGK